MAGGTWLKQKKRIHPIFHLFLPSLANAISLDLSYLDLAK